MFNVFISMTILIFIVYAAYEIFGELGPHKKSPVNSNASYGFQFVLAHRRIEIGSVQVKNRTEIKIQKTTEFKILNSTIILDFYVMFMNSIKWANWF